MRAHAALAGAIAGAWLVVDAPWWLVAAAVVVAIRLRALRWIGPVALAGALLLVTGGAAAHAWAALDFPPPGSFDEWVTLVDDPRPSGPVGVRVIVRAGDRRLTATAHGPVAGRLDDSLAGERVRLIGSVRPVAPTDERSIAVHVVGRITVAEVADTSGAAPVGRFANTVRRTLDRGAASLDRRERPLFLGMVVGDDRAQAPVTADDFRAAGLGHLLVVSGQNVAFVLAVAMPLVGRFRPAGRALSLFVLLGLFAVVTRFEPSVLRATAMAGVGIGSAALGRPVDGRKGLSLACAGLLVVDPFLVRLAAFQLSAAATAGIVWFGTPLAERLPGPAWVRVPLSTTAAAQLAVSPVLVSIFGPIPVASLPANLLAGPASGAVMVWGCTAGLIAGMVGGPVATGLHLPTRALLWWVDEIASHAAMAPPAMLGPGSLTLLGASAAGAVLFRRHHGPGWVAGGVATLVLLVAVRTAATAPDGMHPIGEGITLVTRAQHSVVVLDDPGSPRAVLEAVRLAGVEAVDLLVARDGDRADADAVVALRDRYGPVAAAAPPLHRVPGGRTVSVGQTVSVGEQRIHFGEVVPRLEFTVLASTPGR